MSGELDHLAIREKGINLGGKAKQLAEEIADAVENNPGMMKVFAVKASLLNSIEGVLGATLQTAAGLLKSLGPIGLVAILIGKIIEKIADFVKGTIEIRQNLGVNIVQAAQLSARMEMAATKTALMGGNAETAKDLIGGLVEEFGTINEAAELSSGNVASLATQIGLGGKETAKLLKVMSDVSGETLDSLANQLLFEDSLSEAAGIPTSLVMAQVAENTELFARAGRDGADELFRAARAAADLGTNLGVVESIADSILDIESSLAAQMEAEMLIGRELNLDRARQLAQQNDIEELTREIQSLAGGPQAFANLGRIEQNALANAIGGISIAQLTPFLGGNAGAGAVSGEEQVKVASDQLSAANTTNKILGSVDGKLDALIEATDRNTKEQRRSR